MIRRRSTVRKCWAVLAAGALFQLGLLETCNSRLYEATRFVDPCGTILACDPQEYAFVTSGIDGPGVRPDIDPYCVYPPFCSATQDPIFGGLAP